MGNSPKNKAFVVDYAALAALYPLDKEVWVRLTERQAVALASTGAEYLKWDTRWSNLPYDSDNYGNDIQFRLLQWLNIGDDCNEFPILSLSAASSIWYPQAPEIESAPLGYNNPPFSIVKDGNWLLSDYIDINSIFGLKTGDVISALPNMPNILGVIGGFPSLKINFYGKGSIAVEFVSIITGGYALVGVDSMIDLLTPINLIIGSDQLRIVDLEVDVTSFPPESASTQFQEFNFSEEKNHFLHIVFVPKLDDSLIPIGYGGGLRSVMLCGLLPMGLDTLPEFQIINGVLGYYVGNQWVEIGATNDCDCNQEINIFQPPLAEGSISPIPQGSDGACSSATALVNVIVNTYNQTVDEMDRLYDAGISTAQAAIALLAFLGSLFAFFPAYVLFNLAISTFILRLIQLWVDGTELDRFDGDKTSAICAARAVIGNDGSITESAIQAALANLPQEIGDLIRELSPNAIIQTAYTQTEIHDCFLCEIEANWVLDISGSRIWDNPVWSFPVGGLRASNPSLWRLSNGLGFAIYSYGAHAAEINMPQGSYHIVRFEVYMEIQEKYRNTLSSRISYYTPTLSELVYSDTVSPVNSFGVFDIASIHTNSSQVYNSNKYFTALTIPGRYLGNDGTGDKYSYGVIKRVVLYGSGDRAFQGLIEEREL